MATAKKPTIGSSRRRSLRATMNSQSGKLATDALAASAAANARTAGISRLRK
jgi:hypothetical protein